MTQDIITVTCVPWVTLIPGERAEARLGLSVAEGFHVQANPAGGPFLLPLQIAFSRQQTLRAGRPRYPAGQRFRLQGSADPLLVYSGKFDLVVPVEAFADAEAGDYFLKGTLRYQACDARTCLFPASLPIVVPVEVLTPINQGKEVAVPVQARPFAQAVRS